MSCLHPEKRVSSGERWSRAPYPSAGSASQTRSPRPLCFWHLMTAVTSRALSCSSTEASRKSELRVHRRPNKEAGETEDGNSSGKCRTVEHNLPEAVWYRPGGGG